MKNVKKDAKKSKEIKVNNGSGLQWITKFIAGQNECLEWWFVFFFFRNWYCVFSVAPQFEGASLMQ